MFRASRIAKERGKSTPTAAIIKEAREEVASSDTKSPQEDDPSADAIAEAQKAKTSSGVRIDLKDAKSAASHRIENTAPDSDQVALSAKELEKLRSIAVDRLADLQVAAIKAANAIGISDGTRMRVRYHIEQIDDEFMEWKRLIKDDVKTNDA